jgi:hypothetical protein
VPVRDRWSALGAAALALALLAAVPPVQPVLGLGPAETLAPGIELYRLDRADLLSPPGPVAVRLLRLDPLRSRLEMALAQDQVLGAETVQSMARRRGAIAAINAGFFVIPTGEPAGLMKTGGVLVSDAPLARGAVAIAKHPGGGTELVFDQVSVSLELELRTRTGTSAVRVDGVDTVRPAGQLVWFNRAFNLHTDTTDAGTEWVINGASMAVAERRASAMRTVIPDGGAVLSYGGTRPAPPLSDLDAGKTVCLNTIYTTTRGTAPAIWERVPDAIGGAGLLVYDGTPVKDWSVEQLRAGFATERHPRTMIGVDAGGRIWLVTVDGRNPDLSLGMSFAELQGLARTLQLRAALNLDGGGSTTMVVKGTVVNHPSDAEGPRKVSDAILVFPASR